MAALEVIFAGDETEWIDALPASQRNFIHVLISQNKSYDEIAVAWLSAGGPTFPFSGTKRDSKVFFEELVEEIEEFLCGKDRYIEDRKRLLTRAEGTKTFVISSKSLKTFVISEISLAIALVVREAPPYIAPVVALVLITVTKLGRNAWCEMRQGQKSNLQKEAEQ